MFIIKKNRIPLFFVSSNFSDAKKKVKEVVGQIRNFYMSLGQVFVNYSNKRANAIVTFLPYNILNGIPSTFCTLEIVELNY